MSETIYDFPSSSEDRSDQAPMELADFGFLGEIDASMTVGEVRALLREKLGLDKLRPWVQADLKQVAKGLFPTGIPRRVLLSPQTVTPVVRRIGIDLLTQTALALLTRDVILPSFNPAETAGEGKSPKQRKPKQGA